MINHPCFGKISVLAAVVVFVFLLAACSSAPAQLPGKTGTPTATASKPTPSPTVTNTPTPTLLPTLAPTPTPAQLTSERIQADNADRLQFLKRIGHGTPERVHYSPDGKMRAVIFSLDICFYEARGTDPLACYGEENPGGTDSHGDSLRVEIALAPDFHTFMMANGSEIGVFRAVDGVHLRTLHASGDVTYLLLSDDGRVLSSWGREGNLELWDVDSGKRLGELVRKSWPRVALSPDGSLAAVSSEGQDLYGQTGRNQVDILALPGLETLYSFQAPNPIVGQVRFSPDSKLLAVASNGSVGNYRSESTSNGLVTIIDVAAKKTAWTGYSFGPVRDLAFSADGSRFVFSSRSPQVVIWETENWKQVKAVTASPAYGYNSIGFSADGQKLVAASAGPNGINFAAWKEFYPLYIWDTVTGKLISSFDGRDAFFNAGKIAFSPVEDVFTIITPVDISLWQNGSPAVFIEGLPILDGGVAAFSPDGKLLVTGMNGGQLGVINTATGKIVKTLGSIDRDWADEYKFPLKVDTIVFAPDGTRLVVLLANGQVILWDLAHDTSQVVVDIKPQTSESQVALQILFSPDPEQLVIAQMVTPEGQARNIQRVFFCTMPQGPCTKEETYFTTKPFFLFLPGSNSLSMIFTPRTFYQSSDLWLLDYAQCKDHLKETPPINCPVVYLQNPVNRADSDSVSRQLQVIHVSSDGFSLAVVSTLESPYQYESYFSNDTANGFMGQWDLTGKLTRWTPFYKLTHNYPYYGSTFSPDQRFALVIFSGRLAQSNREVFRTELWDVREGRMLLQRESYFKGLFSPDNSLLALPGNPLQLWGIRPSGSMAFQVNGASQVVNVDYSDDGQSLWAALPNQVNRLRLADQAQEASLPASGKISAFARSTADALIAYATQSGEVQVLSTPDDRVQWKAWPVAGTVTCLAFSPDDAFLAASDAAGQVSIFSAADGQVLQRLKVGNTAVTSLAFDRHGLLAVGLQNGAVSTWRVQAGTREQDLAASTARVNVLAFSPDGSVLAAGDASGVISLWNPADGTLLRAWQAHNHAVSGLAYSPDGSLLASASQRGLINLWSQSHGLIQTLALQELPPAPNGVYPNDTYTYWFTTNMARKDWSLAERMTGVRFSADGRTLLAFGEDGWVHTWVVADETTNRWMPQDLRQTLYWESDANFTTQSQMMWMTSSGLDLARNGQAWAYGNAVWGEPDGALRQYTEHGPAMSVAFTPDSKQLAMGLENGTIDIRSLANNSFTLTIPAFQSMVLGLKISADGNTLAAFSIYGDMAAYSLPGGELLWKITGGSTPFSIHSLAISADNSLVAFGDSKGQIILRKATDGSEVHKFQVALGRSDYNPITCLDFSPDGKTLAACSFTGAVYFFPLDGTEPARQLKIGTETIQCLAYSPDGKMLVTCDVGSRAVQFWLVADGGLIRAIPDGSGYPQSASFSADGQRLAVGYLNGYFKGILRIFLVNIP